MAMLNNQMVSTVLVVKWSCPMLFLYASTKQWEKDLLSTNKLDIGHLYPSLWRLNTSVHHRPPYIEHLTNLNLAKLHSVLQDHS
jgi:hypothetical protein